MDNCKNKAKYYYQWGNKTYAACEAHLKCMRKLGAAIDYVVPVWKIPDGVNKQCEGSDDLESILEENPNFLNDCEDSIYDSE
jgi:hypothetical protein